ncbi:response regulator transcription factor [Enterococcus raffinosus]|uniref:Heme response regulator HssR n=1 Tax=Enterococcus raffinosus TaxID=71452 RepID=A0AAW8T6Z4_9ENTE|nr:response regulator transcription factor [Enterococcus raffinosus]MDT2522108.1 response regulator transcription factor [Enterococcus raffinosus]MDT2528452.1 response regulator transcription factor [Enterococcus raffinosus]MDT2533081.1 response regulator transcription factor [Enterococcus raffinosus]MDT2543521.1 response regulator transcription factor [Enterococcus raffinosus]MDT2553635.1 response regulator transcription factor [Enterococcus raffinosus]
MNRILIVEDDENLSLLYQSALKNERFEVFRAMNGIDALDILDKQFIDLIISDIMMPDMDGYELAESLREADYDLPILFITAKDSFEDKKRGFKIGIDDYMVKPIDVNEMLLRVDALLRRAQIVHTKELTIGDTRLDQETYQIKTPLLTETLPQKEFLLLYKLLAYPNKIFTRQQLMDEIWGLDSDTDERTIDVHIKRLRTRLETNPNFSIETIRGLGYKAVIHT